VTISAPCTVHGADPRVGGELGDDLVIGQSTQDVRVQLSVGHPLGKIAQRVDLAPGQTGLAQFRGFDAEQCGG
jgi:hypothetical protein